MSQRDICPTCGATMEWEDCDVCGGEGYLDDYNPDPPWHDDAETCNLCDGDRGWYECPNYHNHPTETDRTASDTASSTPAGTPATPLAGRQQVRQQEEAL